MGCQIRFESFISTGALCAFTLLYYFFNLSRKDKVKACVQMILMFTIVFSLEIAHNLYYTNTPEWKEFTLYNSARTQLSDYKENYIPLYFENGDSVKTMCKCCIAGTSLTTLFLI